MLSDEIFICRMFFLFASVCCEMWFDVVILELHRWLVERGDLDVGLRWGRPLWNIKIKFKRIKF